MVVVVGHLELAAHARRSFNLHPVEAAAGCLAVTQVAWSYRDVRLRPVRSEVVAHAGNVIDDESGFAVDVSGQRRAHRPDGPGFDVPGRGVERFLGVGGRDELALADLDAALRYAQAMLSNGVGSLSV
jgi:hypothetical protein